jgi:hypothetical protein
MNVTRALALHKKRHKRKHNLTSHEYSHHLRSDTKENTNKRHKSACNTYVVVPLKNQVAVSAAFDTVAAAASTIVGRRASAVAIAGFFFFFDTPYPPSPLPPLSLLLKLSTLPPPLPKSLPLPPVLLVPLSASLRESNANGGAGATITSEDEFVDDGGVVCFRGNVSAPAPAFWMALALLTVTFTGFTNCAASEGGNCCGSVTLRIRDDGDIGAVPGRRTDAAASTAPGTFGRSIGT